MEISSQFSVPMATETSINVLPLFSLTVPIESLTENEKWALIWQLHIPPYSDELNSYPLPSPKQICRHLKLSMVDAVEKGLFLLKADIPAVCSLLVYGSAAIRDRDVSDPNFNTCLGRKSASCRHKQKSKMILTLAEILLVGNFAAQKRGSPLADRDLYFDFPVINQTDVITFNPAG